MISVVRDNSINTFLTQASESLYSSEAENGLILGLSENILHGRLAPKIPPLLLRLLENGKTVAAAIQTPPFKILLTSMTDAQVNTMVEFIKKESIDIPGVFAPSLTAQKLNQSLQKIPKVNEVLKLYKLEKVTMPGGSGRMDVANLESHSLLAKWFRDFSLESLPPDEHKSESMAQEQMRLFIDQKTAYVLIDKETVVAMAIVNRTTKNGASIAYVYTPPHLRKMGYASLLVAKLSQYQLDLGKSFCVLYADAINPTSNKIYQRIGYNWLNDSALVLY